MIFGKWFKRGGKVSTLSEKKILIVDDNEVDRKLLEQILKKRDFCVITAEDGDEGYALAKKHLPDLILSDCSMPNMDGIEMFHLLKEEDATRQIPLIFLTANDSPSHLVECFEKGAENYLCKPINAKVIASQVEEMLEDHLNEAEDSTNG